MKKVAVIMLGGIRQKDLFWKSYNNCISGYPHDLIVVHRDYAGFPSKVRNYDGRMIIENKIIQ